MALGGHHNQSAFTDFNGAERQRRIELGQASGDCALGLLDRLLRLDPCSHDESVGRRIGELLVLNDIALTGKHRGRHRMHNARLVLTLKRHHEIHGLRVKRAAG